MNLRKLFALLMTAVMLLGMIPVGHAELTDCNHDWDSGKWLSGEPKNCTDWKQKTYTCTICGATRVWDEVGPCQPGSQTWIRPQGSNCQEYGVWEITCKHCGEWLEGGEEPGPHKWVTRTIEEPACEYPGLKQTVCSYCGDEKDATEEIPPTGHDWGDWKLDVAATCNKEGLRVRYCKRCNHREEQEVPAGNHQWGSYVTETPAGCETPGEEFSYCSVCGEKGSYREIPPTGHDWGDWKWEVEATCNKEGLRVRYCKRCNMREEDYVQGGKHSYGPYKTYREPTCTERGLEYMTCTRCGDESYRYIDIIDHNFGEWYVVAEAQIGLTGVEQRDCTYGCGTFEQREIPALEQEFIPAPPSISKVVINTPANGEYFVAGESIVYRITLTNNTGMALKGVALYDPLYSTPVISPDGEGSLAIAPHLADGESISGEFSYDVTAELALSGKVVNTAEAVYVYADDPQAMLYRAYSNTLETPVGIGDLPELHCSFGQSNVPANNEYYVPGETVRFEVEYSNPSLQDLVMGYVLAHVKDVPAVDVSGLATMTVLDAADVPAGESAFAYISYTVTEEDAARGAIYGYAAFTANLPNGTPVKAAITDFVTVPCGVEEDVNEEPVSAEGLELTLVLSSTPANGTHFVVGEKVTFTSRWSNGTGKTLYPFSVNSWTCDTPVLVSGANQIISWVAEDSAPVVPGATGSLPMTVTVTEADVARGAIYAMAELLSTVQGGADLEIVTTPFVTAPCGVEENGSDKLSDASLTLTMEPKYEYGPDNGTHYVLGERPWTNWKLHNNSESVTMTLDKVRYYLDGNLYMYWKNEINNRVLAPGADFSDHTSWYYITEEDIARGYVTVIIETDCIGDDGKMYYATAKLELPCGPGELPDDYVPPVDDGSDELKDITFTKRVYNTPANGEFFVPGEELQFVLRFNLADSNTAITFEEDSVYDIRFYDSLTHGQNIIYHSDKSYAISVFVYYTVTEEDAQRGYVENTAYVTFSYTEGGETVRVDSNTVTAPCGPGELPVDPSLTMGDPYGPANGTHYVLGETVRPAWTVKNNSEDRVVTILGTTYNWNDEAPFTSSSTETLKPGRKVTRRGVTRWVTQEDVTRGYTTINVVEFCSDGENEYTLYNSLQVPCGPGELPDDYQDPGSVMLTLTEWSSPANGTHYVPGESINVHHRLYNSSRDVTMTVGHEHYFQINGDGIKEENAWVGYIVLLPGTSHWLYSWTPTVTEADAARGYVERTTTFYLMGDDGDEYTATGSIRIPCGPGELPDDYVPPVNPDIDEDGIPNEEDPDIDGDGIPNEEDPDIDGDGIPNGEDPDVDGDGIPNGEDTDVDGDGTPNGSDPDVDGDGIPNGEDPDVDGDGILNGEDDDVDGDGTPNGDDPDVDGDGIPNGEDPDVDGDGIPNGEDPDVDGDGIPNGTDPDENGDGKPEDAFGVLTGMEIMKSVESLPMNGSFYTEGETVAYKITYTNSGENELINVAIYDAMSGLAEIASAEKLTPGESRTCFFNYTVTAADVARGYIANTAVGEYEVGGYSSSVNSNTMMVDTDGKVNSAIVPPLFGDDDGSDYDPSTGWTDDSAAGEDGESLFGVIDTDQLRSGETHCAITITGRDNASVGYEISFCAAHAATQASALMMKQASATPEMQMQAASYAVALWRTEVESAYQKLLTAADPTAQAVLLTEYIRFVTDLDNYEAILNALYPDQPALVAGKIADMWQDKCVALCHEMHTLAADRKDSLLSVEAASGAVANVCGCDITLEENGKKAFAQTYCPVHSFPYSMIDMLLGGKDTAETWAMVRQIWGVELTNAYSKVAAKLGDNGAAAKAGYAVMTQWMMAREASLIALYPENPELVAQTMVKLIMDRVNNLCLTGK